MVIPMRIMGDISLAVTELALAGWTLFATNVPSDRLTVREALMLGRALAHRTAVQIVKSHRQSESSSGGARKAARSCASCMQK